MSESVYTKDARIIETAIAAMLAPDDAAPVYWYSRSRVDVSLANRETYSYGRHFPLFRYVPRNGRHSALFVINGDSIAGGGWGNRSRTPEHQSAARRLIEATGVASCVIPFSALTGAGLDIDSIRVIHARDDANWEETRYADSLAGMPRHHRTTGAYETRRARSLEDVPAGSRHTWTNGEYGELAPDDDGWYVWREWVTRDVDPGPDGRYSWTVHVHRLGDCLFSARAIGGGPRRRYLSSFDYQERAPLYFLAQVPRGAGETVEQAVDSLAPRAVWAARARGRRVERQGDIFFIETALSDDELAARGIVSRARLTQWTRDARAHKGETGYVRETAAEKRARVKRFRSFRRAEFRRMLAEFETSTRERYQAPRDRRRYVGQVRTYGRDRAAMAAHGAQVWNTADNGYLTDGNRARAAWQRAAAAAMDRHGSPELLRPRDYRERVRRALAVYGTAHSAREVCRVKGGAVYVRGKVSHVKSLDSGRPSWDSAPDHMPLELSQSVWYLAVRNTVPRSRAHA